MYIESKPASIHLQQPAVNMDSTRVQLHRPPASLNHSSSSLLRGMERTAPSFQDFVRRTPPVEREKPLPPVPDAETSPISRHQAMTPRRSSSVYSRTVSQWAPTPESLRSLESDDPNVFLQPSVYSLSTPNLATDTAQEDQEALTLLQPRVYKPLIRSPTPSPDPSTVNTPMTEVSKLSFEESFDERHNSALLPPVAPAAFRAPYTIDTMPLEKKKAAVSRDAVFHAPDELRSMVARAFRKSRSSEELGVSSGSSPSSPLLQPFHDIKQSTRQEPEDDGYHVHAIVQPSPWASPSTVKFKLRDSKLSDKYFGMDPVVRTAAARASRQLVRRSSSTTSVHSLKRKLSDDQGYEDRGRRRNQVAVVVHETDTSNQDATTSQEIISNATVMDQADRLAQEYQDLLPKQGFDTSRMSGGLSSNSKDAKLIPRPLFFNPRQVSRQRIEEYNRKKNGNNFAFNSSHRSNRQLSPAVRWQNDSLTPRFPLKLSLTPDSVRTRSTSGSIPISPPPVSATSFKTQSSKKASLFSSVLSPGLNKLRRSGHDDDDLNSPSYSILDMYSPDYDNEKKNTAAAEHSPVPPVGATIVATRAEAEAAFNVSAAPKETDTQGPKHQHKHKISDGSVESSQPVAKHHHPLSHVGGKMATLTHAFHRMSTKHPGHGGLFHHSDTGSHADGPRSSNLSISAPITQNSDSLLASLDAGRGTTKNPAYSMAQKKHGLFAHAVDKRRESKAVKRREELKRSIRLVSDAGIDVPGSQQKGAGGAHRWL